MRSQLHVLVGERIRVVRKEKGFTQEQLAEKSGVYVTYISDIERGERNISLETLDKVLTALEISPVELFRAEGVEEIEERNDKKILIDAFASLLLSRKTEEVQMLLKVAKEVLGTFDRLDK